MLLLLARVSNRTGCYRRRSHRNETLRKRAPWTQVPIDRVRWRSLHASHGGDSDERQGARFGNCVSLSSVLQQGTPARHGRTWQMLERGGKLEQHSIVHVKEYIVHQVANRKYVMAHAALFDHVALASSRLKTRAFQARHPSQP